MQRVDTGHQMDGESPDPPPDQNFPRASISSLPLHGATGANLDVPGRSVRSVALGLRRDSHGSVKQVHHKELKDGEKERPSEFPQIMLKQTYSGIQQLAPARERA